MQCLGEGTFTVFPKHCFCIAYSNANKASEYERFRDLLQRESNTSFSELLPHAQAAQETRSTRLYFQSVLTGGGNPQSHHDRKPAVSNARTQAKGTKNDLKKRGHFNTAAFTAFCTGWGPHASHCVAGKLWCRSLLQLKSTPGLSGVSWPRQMPRDIGFASPFAFFPTHCKSSRCRLVQRYKFQGNCQNK